MFADEVILASFSAVEFAVYNWVFVEEGDDFGGGDFHFVDDALHFCG